LSILFQPLTLVHLALAGLVLLTRPRPRQRQRQQQQQQRRHDGGRAEAVLVAATLVAYMASIEMLPDSCPASRSVVKRLFRMAVFASCPSVATGPDRACRDKVYVFYYTWVPMLTAAALGTMAWWNSLVTSWRGARSAAKARAEEQRADRDGSAAELPRRHQEPSAAPKPAAAEMAPSAPGAPGAPRAARAQGRPSSVSYTAAHDNITYNGRVTQNVYNEGKDHGDLLPASRFAEIAQWTPTYESESP
jgi:hypothetical protein